MRNAHSTWLFRVASGFPSLTRIASSFLWARTTGKPLKPGKSHNRGSFRRRFAGPWRSVSSHMRPEGHRIAGLQRNVPVGRVGP
jgi:hypothetical protein